MEWTYVENTTIGPVHSGYLGAGGTWVYEGGIAENFSNWTGWQQGFVWAWAKGDELMGDAEEPARQWYEDWLKNKYRGEDQDWTDHYDWANDRTTCRGAHQFLRAP